MSSLIRFRPLSPLGTLQGEMNQLFERFFGREAADDTEMNTGFLPPANVSETSEEIVVSCELPGVEAKDLDVSVTGDLLTIKGTKHQEQEKKSETWHRVERSYGSFVRSFRLPAPVVPDKVAADYKNGIVRITLPKTDESKRREVKIKVQ